MATWLVWIGCSCHGTDDSRRVRLHALDPSFLGNPIQLEIWSTGPLPIVLKPGMRICQLIFELVDGTPEQGYTGQFAIQGPMS
jgi:deoxycytidine triphosphate deaminase